MSEPTLVPLSEADLGWAWDVYRATTQEHIEQVVDRTEDQQRDERLAGLRGGSFEAILDGTGQRVGLVETTDDGDELTIRHLELLPSAQGGGIGTAVIQGVVARATASGKSVSLRVLRVNARARVLYERLGFVVEQERAQSTQMRYIPSGR